MEAAPLPEHLDLSKGELHAFRIAYFHKNGNFDSYENKRCQLPNTVEEKRFAFGGLIPTDVKRAVELLEKLQHNSHFPRDKLQALQSILESDFFSAVREVYEHVYQTVDVVGSAEVRANATAKATIAAFAAAQGHAHPRVVLLPKTDEGLGFNVMGGREQNTPIYISRIIPGGVADRHGGLRRGDQLLAVDGVNIEGENHERAVDLLKSAKGHVKLVVRYAPHILEEMEQRFDRQRAARRRQP